jgi:hypothetical protein
MGDPYLLRIEGVNLDSFVYDTQNLSTVRGGGLALLNAVDWVAERFRLEPVTTGASAGIFRFEADGPDAAESVRAEVATFLRTHEHPFETAGERTVQRRLSLGHATFVVDVVASSGDFVADREALLALNRWRQMQSPSLALAGGATSSAVCGVDRRRPAAVGLRGPDGEPVSESVYQRWQYGRSQKQRFYEDLTGVSFEMGFSQSFEELTDDPGRGNLHGKMAVLFLDGNRFGGIQDRHCTDAERQQHFDVELRRLRRELLADILDRARNLPDFRESGGAGPIRFETLLWGGDEVLWVVPAWRGWWLLEFFCERSRDWTIEFPPEVRVPLRHAGGLVFCHHNAPIYRIRHAVAELARLAKVDPERNLVAYQVFESFDYAGGELAELRRRRSPPGLGDHDLLLEGSKLQGVLASASSLRDSLPHGQVLALVRRQVEDAPAEDAQLAAHRAQILSALPPERRPDLDRLLARLGGEQVAWLHLAELWDYLAAPDTEPLS